jgi:replicative DNA helicase
MSAVADSSLRRPPQAVEAEQALLGALLLDNRVADAVAGIVTEASFYDASNRTVFAAILRLVRASKPADVVTVWQHLQARAEDEAIGGLPYLNALAQSTPGPWNAKRYAELVADRAMLRALIAACNEAAGAAFAAEGKTAAEVVAEVAAKLAGLERQQMPRAPQVLADVLVGRLDRLQALADGVEQPGIPTGIPRLDRALSGGLKPGGVYVLAARPSVGKSSFAQAIGLKVAGSAGPVLMLSQEMPDAEVADRALSHLSRVDYGSIQTGDLDHEAWGRVTDGVEAGRELPFWIDDQPALKVGDIRAKARAVKGLKLLIVDYVQLCASDEKTGANRNTEIEAITRALKALAKDMQMAILLLSQLNREVEKRPGKEPMLSDLRDSGAIEQDADVVMFLWPHRERDLASEGSSRLVGCKLEKNRQGSKPRFLLDFHGAHQRWGESLEDFTVEAPRRARDL